MAGSSESEGDLGDGEEGDETGEVNVSTGDPPSPPSEELVDRIMEEIWWFNDSYSVSHVVRVRLGLSVVLNVHSYGEGWVIVLVVSQ